MRMSTRRKVSALVLAAVFCGGLSLVAFRDVQRARAQPQRVPLTPAELVQVGRLAGQFAFVSGDSRESLHRALVGATPSSSATAARLTWAQVEMMLLPAKRVAFRAEGLTATSGSLEIRSGSATLRAELDGVLRPISAKRADVRVSQRVQGAALQQIVENRGFRLERSFSLDRAGNALALEVRVTGQSLSTPVWFKANYRRL